MTKLDHNEENQVSAEFDQTSEGKKRYCAPVLTILGSVNDITRGFGIGIADVAATSAP